jgi:hypothetical protein
LVRFPTKYQPSMAKSAGVPLGRRFTIKGGVTPDYFAQRATQLHPFAEHPRKTSNNVSNISSNTDPGQACKSFDLLAKFHGATLSTAPSSREF